MQGCLDWVAHGFEIVHTHFEDWRFTAADTVADFALHGRLRVGPRVPVQDWRTLAEDMAALQVELLCDGKGVDRGQGAVVLDGPLNALRLWVDAMAEFTPDWPVRPGDVVTTGTFTIPMMKKVGFSSEKAGAVEVASSVNGQIMPPVMGAAAFLMVEYVGIPYVEIIKHAFLPATNGPPASAPSPLAETEPDHA